MTIHQKPDAPDEYSLTDADRLRFAEERARGLRVPQDPCLLLAANQVEPQYIGSPEIVALVTRMRIIARGQRRSSQLQKKRRTLVGLAAPQIGELKRIVLVDVRVDESRRHLGRLECFINPEIIWRSHEMQEGREGCFSTGPVWGLVRRPMAIKIRAYNLQGKLVEKVLEGFSARIACHELDHLDGIRFPERITNDRKRHWVHTEELLDYPDQSRHWPRICSLERWRQFIGATEGESYTI